MAREVFPQGYLPLFAGAELVRRSGLVYTLPLPLPAPPPEPVPFFLFRDNFYPSNFSSENILSHRPLYSAGSGGSSEFWSASNSGLVAKPNFGFGISTGKAVEQFSTIGNWTGSTRQLPIVGSANGRIRARFYFQPHPTGSTVSNGSFVSIANSGVNWLTGDSGRVELRFDGAGSLTARFKYFDDFGYTFEAVPTSPSTEHLLEIERNHPSDAPGSCRVSIDGIVFGISPAAGVDGAPITFSFRVEGSGQIGVSMSLIEIEGFV